MKLDKRTLNKIKPWAVLAVFCTALLYILLHISDISDFVQKMMSLCVSLFYAIGIAYVLNIPMTFFENLLKKYIKPKNWFYGKIRAMSIFLTVILALMIISILLSIIIPQVVSSAVLLTNNLVSYANNIVNFINDFLMKINLEDTVVSIDPNLIGKYLESITANWETLLQTATNWVGDAGQMLVKNAMAVTVVLGNWFMGFMLSLYMLSSKEVFICQMRKIVAALFPVKITRKIFEIGSRANDIFSSFISGQLVEACILGVLIYFGMQLFGLGKHYEILISVVVAITSIIPMFGAMFAMAFGFVLILATNPIEALIFIVFFQTVQQLEGNLIYPHVVGKSVGLPAIWVLLSIVVFGGLFGLVGMLVAVPATALIYSLLRDLVNWRLARSNMKVTTYSFIADDKEEIEDISEE